MVNEKLKYLAEKFFNGYEQILKLNLTSMDGFTIYSRQIEGGEFETDKISAVVSSLTSLSQVTSSQLLASQLLNTVIETDKGNMIMFPTVYQDEPAILIVISNVKFKPDEINNIVHQLAEDIKVHTSLKPMAKILNFARV
jgi:predicted regulator of Ras-like GTPase activity (Roadblock/LC7/MglB family)